MRGGDFAGGGGETYSLVGEGCAVCSPLLRLPRTPCTAARGQPSLLCSAAVTPFSRRDVHESHLWLPPPALQSPLSPYVSPEGIESPPHSPPPWLWWLLQARLSPGHPMNFSFGRAQLFFLIWAWLEHSPMPPPLPTFFTRSFPHSCQLSA